jgi:16S rRNA (guanine1207-N2)-methyltransferase
MNSAVFEYCLSSHEKARTFEHADGQIRLLARSGLNASENALLSQWKQWKPVKKVLVIENRTGLLGAFYRHLYPESEVTFFAMDCFYSDRLRANLTSHGLKNSFEIVLGADLPETEGGYDEIFIQVSQSLSAELAADYLQQAHQRLKNGGRCWVGAEKKHKATMGQVKKVFTSLSEYPHRHGVIYVAKKAAELKKVKDYASQFETRVCEGLQLQIETRPGVFSHRRPDGGALALLDLVNVEEEDQVLEMGCGCGVVGLGLQKKYHFSSLSLLDSHTRALQTSLKNAELNALPEPKVQCSSRGWSGEETFDVFIGNPPYFGDHQISALFIDTAAEVLKEGGVMWLVAKNMDWNWEYAQGKFKDMELLSRRGYQVLRCVKS